MSQMTNEIRSTKQINLLILMKAISKGPMGEQPGVGGFNSLNGIEATKIKLSVAVLIQFRNVYGYEKQKKKL